MQSEQIDLLVAALVKAQATMKPAVMNKVNPHFKSKYADLAAVIELVRKPLTDNGLAFTQTTYYDAQEGMRLETTLLHTSGQWLRSDYPLPVNATPQQMGSALTYARRYSLSAITGTAADEDDDGDKAEVTPGKKIHAPEPTYSDGKKIGPHEITIPDKPRQSDWVEFGQLLLASVNGAATDAEAKAWKEANRRILDMMASKQFPHPELAERLDLALQKIGPKHAP